MSSSLEERLRANSNAFEGLLALIPAKYYYDEDTQEQWKAKKKSKSQAKDDKQKKLDPDQMDQGNMSTLEVMKQRESISKPVVLPGEKLNLLKRQEQKIRGEEVEEPSQEEHDEEPVEEEEKEDETVDMEQDAQLSVFFDDEGNEVANSDDKVPAEGQGDKTLEKQEKRKNIDALRSKLQAKIQDLKEKRKAPGSRVKGAPSSREAILAERKRKIEMKKALQPQKAEANESDNSDSDIDDGSDNENSDQQRKKRKLSKDEDEDLAAGVMFQNITFDDGNRLTSDLQSLRKGLKKKGPAKNDIKAHLKVVEAKRNKMESKDELDQIKIKEKEKWQRAMLQAEGVKIKDNEKLLRKALKRKEAKKRKSSIDWKERQRIVADTKSEKQKRREENLQIRKDNKGVKRSKQQKMKRKFNGSMVAKKSRAGFEGRLKTGKKK
ncbi:hypothetical protein HG535_0H00500 [Zygotorulaspora mrakii]|uniref:Ribosomal RNA-processing protein 14/surfeit locus protein 6 C-terminal domain-containing protein n=1 Tax=Zygotorulaspora mrakii TaxID=42260 RepID=A0A7H9B7S8_ZYGMR|nr:uncharacterized protein HG535_0H00500 [Zygotorulaspora mrakii]QLG74725.1 hypothetical protein HG535_0H00500 [Zygotorulaspora mrakii]